MATTATPIGWLPGTDLPFLLVPSKRGKNELGQGNIEWWKAWTTIKSWEWFCYYYFLWLRGYVPNGYLVHDILDIEEPAKYYSLLDYGMVVFDWVARYSETKYGVMRRHPERVDLFILQDNEKTPGFYEHLTTELKADRRIWIHVLDMENESAQHNIDKSSVQDAIRKLFLAKDCLEKQGYLRVGTKCNAPSDTESDAESDAEPNRDWLSSWDAEEGLINTEVDRYLLDFVNQFRDIPPFQSARLSCVQIAAREMDETSLIDIIEECVMRAEKKAMERGEGAGTRRRHWVKA